MYSVWCQKFCLNTSVQKLLNFEQLCFFSIVLHEIFNLKLISVVAFYILEAKSNLEEDTDEVEVIRCVCNIYRDEGLMILCEKCNVSKLSADVL